MTFEIIVLLTLISGALILFVSEIIPMDLTAIVVMVMLMVTGLVTPEEGVAGFSNSATLTVLALLIISLGLQNTGVVEYIGNKLIAVSGNNPTWILLMILLVTGFLSAFLNNTAVVALFIPVVFQISHAKNISASKLLIPLSFAAMVGGSATLIGTSTNLLLNSVSQSYGFEGFTLFEFTTLGGLLFLVLIIYMIFIGTRLLPERREGGRDNLTDQYDLNNYLTELVVQRDFPYLGKSLEDSPLIKNEEIEVLEIIRDDGVIWLPDEVQQFKEHDILVVKTNLKEIFQVEWMEGLAIRPNISIADETLDTTESILIEVLIGINSDLIGQKISDIGFRKLYNAVPLAVRRKGTAKQTNLTELQLRFGDILLLEVKMAGVEKFYNDKNLIVLQKFYKGDLKYQRLKKDKMFLSIAILGAVVLLAVINILPILISAWLGVIAIFLTKCIDLKKAYENIQWNVIFLLAGLIPLGIAMENSGTDQYLAGIITGVIGDSSPSITIGILFLFSAILTSIISNNAAVVLLAPIVMQISESIGLDAKILLLAILFGCNASFLTPMGYQTNVMVYAPGNYRFTDYLKVGGGLCILFLIVVSFCIPLLY